MSIPRVSPNQIVELSLRNNLLRTMTTTTTLIKTRDLELIRMVLCAGKEIPTHKAPGEITVQCLSGRVALTAEGKTQELSAGQLLYLGAGEPHSVGGIKDSTLLLTLILPSCKPPTPFDVVQEASEESFPASDSPAY